MVSGAELKDLIENNKGTRMNVRNILVVGSSVVEVVGSLVVEIVVSMSVVGSGSVSVSTGCVNVTDGAAAKHEFDVLKHVSGSNDVTNLLLWSL